MGSRATTPSHICYIFSVSNAIFIEHIPRHDECVIAFQVHIVGAKMTMPVAAKEMGTLPGVLLIGNGLIDFPAPLLAQLLILF